MTEPLIVIVPAFFSIYSTAFDCVDKKVVDKISIESNFFSFQIPFIGLIKLFNNLLISRSKKILLTYLFKIKFN